MIQWIEVIKRDSGHVIARPSFGLVGIEKIYNREARKAQGDVMEKMKSLYAKPFLVDYMQSIFQRLKKCNKGTGQ